MDQEKVRQVEGYKLDAPFQKSGKDHYPVYPVKGNPATVIKVIDSEASYEREARILGFMADHGLRYAPKFYEAAPFTKDNATGLHITRGFYIAMERLYGEPLSNSRRSEPDNRKRHILHIIDFIDSVYLVSRLHKNGIIHGDLKAHHFIITEGGIVVIDFGHSALENHEYRTNPPIGNSKFYRDPRCDGKLRDYLADVYALACITHDMVPFNLKSVLTSQGYVGLNGDKLEGLIKRQKRYLHLQTQTGASEEKQRAGVPGDIVRDIQHYALEIMRSDHYSPITAEDLHKELSPLKPKLEKML